MSADDERGAGEPSPTHRRTKTDGSLGAGNEAAQGVHATQTGGDAGPTGCRGRD